MKNLKLILSAVVLASLSSCVNDDTYGVPDLSKECVTITKTKEVTDITNIATSSAAQYALAEGVTQDYIEAYVTSSDEGGNFYKTISMMSLDGTKGFSMPVDNYNLFNEFEPGRKVTIKLDGNRYFMVKYNSTIIGSSFGSEVGRISGGEYKNVILRSCDNVNEDDIVKHMTIAEAKNDQYLNMLIEFDAVQLTDASLGKKYYDPSLNSIGGATNHTLRDAAGNTIIVRVSEYAKFAGKGVPSGNGKVRGVLTKFCNSSGACDYQFMIRTEKDLQLTGERLDYTFLQSVNEPFTSYSNNASSFANYYNVATAGTYLWQVKTFNSNKYIQMTAFNSGGANRALFVVPVNFNAVNSMSFKTNDGHYNGQPLKVYYSTNFNAQTPNAATLTDITSNFTFSTGHTSGYGPSFVNSGSYSFPSSLTGNGYVIFEYVGASTGITTTMQIDDIVIN